MDYKKLNMLLSILNLFGNDIDFNLDDKYAYDQEIIDCKFKLYILLLPMSDEDQDKRYNEFEKVYVKLSKEKQEYIREDLKKIFKEQDKNNKEKEKKLWEKQ